MLKEDPFFGGYSLQTSDWAFLTPYRWPTSLKPVSKTALRRGDHHVGNSADPFWKPEHLSRHPMLPYLTEELYQRLPPSPTKCESITVAPFPMGVHAWRNEALEKEMEANVTESDESE